jgi:hypothetical protein
MSTVYNIVPGLARVTAITVQTAPAQTDYAEGESFSAQGMVVTATYLGGRTETITDYTYSPTEPLTEADTAVTIAYTKYGVTQTTELPIQVTALPQLRANIDPTDGVTYLTGIADLTPDTLSTYAGAISNNSEITNETETVYVDDGDTHYKISVGDTTTLHIDSYDLTFAILGFNHDLLSDSMAYGAATATGKAGMTIQSEATWYDSFWPMALNKKTGEFLNNTSNWTNNCYLRNVLNPKPAVAPADWNAVVKEVIKKTSVGGGSTEIATTSDRYFVPSEVEVFGETIYSVPGEGGQYAYYRLGHQKFKWYAAYPDPASKWWERSPMAEGDGWCVVTDDESASYQDNFNYPMGGVSPVFCI